ncbi:MAG: mechanosensitive ion channel family protein [Deltaproteobacteria bacterium]
MVKTALRVGLVILALFAGVGYTAEKSGPSPASKQGGRPSAQEAVLDDPLGRSTPQGTVIGFMKAVEQEDYERAVDYLDTKQPPKRAQQLARELLFILDRGLSGSLPNLSKKPEGNLDDMLPPNREKVGVVKTESGSYDIELDRAQKGNESPIWLFSSQTLRQVPQIYEGLGDYRMERYLPKSLIETRLFGYPAWRWIALLLGLPFSFLVAWVISRAFLPLIRVFVRRFTHRDAEGLAQRMKGPIRVLVLAIGFYIYSIFSYSLASRLFWSTVAGTLGTIGMAWLCVRLIDVSAGWMEGRPQEAVSSGRIAMRRLISKLSKGLIVVVAAVIVFYSAGINFTAVLTGLGIGGIAIAFAAQKTLENLFGGIMVISDQPIRVGDFCRAGDYSGVGEDIGLRSTRLRTLNRTVVFVPNGQLATMTLENFTMRDKVLFNHRVQVRYETSPDQLRYVIAEIRKMLYGHPKVETESARVRFTGLKDSSLELEVFAYILTDVFGTFLEVQEDLLLRILEIVEASGTGLALPSQTLYTSQDTGIDKKKGQEATEIVRRWREEGELPFPDFAPEKIIEMDNKLDYPTPDSALHKSRQTDRRGD